MLKMPAGRLSFAGNKEKGTTMGDRSPKANQKKNHQKELHNAAIAAQKQAAAAAKKTDGKTDK